MLLLHQAGSVKIGEVVRYTVTYTPAYDRILPSPSHLHLRVRNTTNVALRVAFVHGPYTLYAAAYPSTFHPDQKFENPRRDGVPEFEPNLKAGAAFCTKLAVPEDVRQTAGTADKFSPVRDSADVKSVSWIIEVTSQVVFSNSAAVHYEVLLGRDEKSLQMGFSGSMAGANAVSAPSPGQLSDHQQSQGAKNGNYSAQSKGIYTRSLKLRVDDTASLWNTPRMPEWDDAGEEAGKKKNADAPTEKVMNSGEDDMKSENGDRSKRQKKVHLVVLTHGLHGNLGADLLYLKESIDAAAKQAKIDRKARKRKEKNGKSSVPRGRQTTPKAYEAAENDEHKRPTSETEMEAEPDSDSEDEEVIVRGFSGNAVRTERGIKYLGKRLAKYVLAMTYPDQPYRPVNKKSAAGAFSHAFRPEIQQNKRGEDGGTSIHENSTIVKVPYNDKEMAYKITSISFIAHSLGGLVQTYAVAYIQKHSPQFFDLIEPINFIALASPFLGLSNENPLYVKFALDFGLVGRTGQDLGLTWRAPTIARSGWGAIVGNIGESAQKRIDGESAPESKPLLRVLPTGPAHIVLKKFRNRTVYSNVVNDGIVPLRTSCLLFLDWSGLGRVEKARRENGLVGTMASWGWAEFTGANSSSPHRPIFPESPSDIEGTPGENTPTRQGHGEDVPQPPPYATVNDDAQNLRIVPHTQQQIVGHVDEELLDSSPVASSNDGPLANFMKFFQPNQSSKPQQHEPRSTRIYKRSQTLKSSSESDTSMPTLKKQPSMKKSRGKATTGEEQDDAERLSAPPTTSFFESAGDIIKPPLPTVDYLIDPKNRHRTIFHDRVYHPGDIPPAPLKKRATSSVLLRRSTQNLSSPSDTSPVPKIAQRDTGISAIDYDDTVNTNPGKDPRDVIDGSAMKVEEKIARAYHRDLSWRKVLVRLEPDAHNNMIVRRMFANAYGWPVIKHLCDTHFADSEEANRRDEDEGNQENAKQVDHAPDDEGGETTHGSDKNHAQKATPIERTNSEGGEAADEVPSLKPNPQPSSMSRALANHPRVASCTRSESDAGWSERDWADSADDTDGEDDGATTESKEGKKAWNWTEAIAGKGATSPRGTDKKDIDMFLGRSSERAERAEIVKASDAAVEGMGTEAAGMGIGLETAPAKSDVGDEGGKDRK